MDILTQALLGSTLSQSAAKKIEIKYAAVIGALSGVLADADILIQSSSDSLLTIEYHRHFSHALVFIPIGALIASIVLWPFFKKRLSCARVYLYSLLGYSMSGVLDACTSYGTHLLWPFSDERIAWHIISIIDPIFTLILLLAVIVALWRQSFTAAHIGLTLAGLYLVLGIVQLQRVESVAEALAESRGHHHERLVVKPTIGNLVLWRSIYQSEGYYYVDALRVGLGANTIYKGDKIKVFDFTMLHQSQPIDSASVLYQDIERFKKLSDGYIALYPGRSEIIGDVRYAMLPTSVRPLWGIEFDVNKPQQHADYHFYRDMTTADRELFKQMLLGD